MMRLSLFCVLACSILFFGNSIGSCAEPAHEAKVVRFVEQLPKREPISLRVIRALTRSKASFEETNQESGNSFPGKENSGIVKSRQYPDLFWVHNDSGDDPKIYPIRASGEDYRSARYAGDLGVTIATAINVDWEDIAINASGQIIVADVGNNRNDRRDLVLYVIPEPSPDAGRTTAIKRYFIRYPEQTAFPPPAGDMNFDCEAVFTIGDTIYCFSKNRGNKLTSLYRLDGPQSDEVTTLTLLETLDLNGQVVGADASEDGKRLAVITYRDLWLFERASTRDSFFNGRVAWAPFKGDQVEAVCFASPHTVFMIDEVSGTLYFAELNELSQLR
jgi:hypothetical protein